MSKTPIQCRRELPRAMEASAGFVPLVLLWYGNLCVPLNELDTNGSRACMPYLGTRKLLANTMLKKHLMATCAGAQAIGRYWMPLRVSVSQQDAVKRRPTVEVDVVWRSQETVAAAIRMVKTATTNLSSDSPLPASSSTSRTQSSSFRLRYGNTISGHWHLATRRSGGIGL